MRFYGHLRLTFPYCSNLSLIGLPFTKLLRNFLQNKTQNFSSFAGQFSVKKQQFAQSFAKVISRKIALFRFCETQVLRNSATRVLHSKLDLESILASSTNSERVFSSAGRFCPIIQNRLSSKSLDNFSFGHAYFLKVDSSGIGYFLAFFYMRLKRFQKFD